MPHIVYAMHTGISKDKIDTLVIGGGLAGCSTAYFLAREGVGVTLLDRGDLNMQASGANAGGFHAQIPHLTWLEQGDAWAATFAPVVPMLVQGIALWATMEAELQTDLECHIAGGILLAETQAQMHDIERRMQIERAVGLEIHGLTQAEVRHLAPYVADTVIGGCFCPTEGKANPLKSTRAFAMRAAERGATIQRHTDVAAIDPVPGGYHVTTSRGVIHTGRIVNAAGADAGRIAAMLGVTLDVQGVPIQVSVTAPVERFTTHLVYAAGRRLTLKQAANGTILIGGGWPGALDTAGRPVVDPASLLGNLGMATALVPCVANAELVRSWAAIVNGTDDWRPILGEVPGHPGFFINFFPWTGFTAGPLASLITAELVLGRKPSFDLARVSVLA